MISIHSLGQSDGPKEITPQVMQQIKTAVNELIPAYKKTLALKELSSDEIAFRLIHFIFNKFYRKE